MTFVIGIALFGAASLLAFVTLQAIVRERREIASTLASIQAFDLVPAVTRTPQELPPGLFSRAVVPFISRTGNTVRNLLPQASVDRLEKLLVYAGSPANLDADRVLAAKVAGAGLLGLCMIALGSGGSLFMRSLMLFVGMAAGYQAPDFLLRSRAGRRQKEIRRELPSTLDLLAVTVEAGLGFDSALARVARNARGPLSEELNRVLREVQLGRSRTEALRELAERCDIPELRSFVLALVQADVFGVSTARVLQVQAAEMRTKRRQSAEEQAQKIPVKITFPLVFCIMPALFVVLLGPAAINVFQSLVSS